MKKAIISLNAVLIAAVCVFNYFYITKDTLLIKSLCSACFAALGVINLIYAEKRGVKNIRFYVIMACGLVFAMLGDVFLELHFITGALFFALGHVLYFVAYCTVLPFTAFDASVSALIFIAGGGMLTFYPAFDFGDSLMKCICIVYALIISFMVGKAIGNLVKKPGALTVLTAIGSILFLFSDTMLVFDVFKGGWAGFGILCHAIYYPSECFLGASCLFEAEKKN